MFAGRKTDPDHGKRAAQTADKSASRAPSRYAEGDRFGAYVLETRIGGGETACLYRAEHQGLKRRVALKVLLAGAGAAPAVQERFLREARMAASIKHPNVVNVFDIGVHEGTPYLVMELLEGSDLARFTAERGRVDEATIMDIAVPIASALAAVHDAGMLHGDLKPANVFLSRSADDQIEPRLLNFGLSNAPGHEPLQLTSATAVFGAACYTPPEVARGLAPTPLSDQYAFGILLYECATGVNPFASASNPVEVTRRVAAGKFEPISSRKVPLSRRLVAIIERAMHVDPTQRFPDVRAMGRELLLLAGQRTRVTWGLSFNELATSHPGKPAFLPARDATSDRRPMTWRRAAYAAAPVLVSVLCVVAWRHELQPTRFLRELASSASEDGPRATPAQPSPPPPPLAGEPSSTAPSHRATRAADVEPSDSHEGAERAPRTAATADEATHAADAPHAAPRGKTASVSRPKPSRPVAAKRVAKKPPPVTDVETKATEDVEPDWLVKNAPSSRRAPELTRGTNAAPILD